MKNPRRNDRGLVVTCNGNLPVYYTRTVCALQYGDIRNVIK